MKEKYLCPICSAKLSWHEGSKLRKYGFTMFCDNEECKCDEVFGFSSKNLDEAYEVIRQKYKL